MWCCFRCGWLRTAGWKIKGQSDRSDLTGPLLRLWSPAGQSCTLAATDNTTTDLWPKCWWTCIMGNVCAEHKSFDSAALILIKGKEKNPARRAMQIGGLPINNEFMNDTKSLGVHWRSMNCKQKPVRTPDGLKLWFFCLWVRVRAERKLPIEELLYYWNPIIWV